MPAFRASRESRGIRKKRRGRPVPFDPEAYRRRNILERLIGWLKECRRIFSRFEKKARHSTAFLTLPFIMHLDFCKLLPSPSGRGPRGEGLVKSDKQGKLFSRLIAHRLTLS